MKTATLISLILLVASGILFGQSPISGKWETTPYEVVGGASVRYEMEFYVDGNKLTGSICGGAAWDPACNTDPKASVSARRIPLEGTIVGDKVTFTLTSPDKQRHITFKGTVGGDSIIFEREAVGPKGGDKGPYAKAGAEQTIKVTRVKY